MTHFEFRFQFFSGYPAIGLHPLLLESHGAASEGGVSGGLRTEESIPEGFSRLLRSGVLVEAGREFQSITVVHHNANTPSELLRCGMKTFSTLQQFSMHVAVGVCSGCTG